MLPLDINLRYLVELKTKDVFCSLITLIESILTIYIIFLNDTFISIVQFILESKLIYMCYISVT